MSEALNTAIQELERSTDWLLEVDKNDLASFVSAMTARTAAALQLRDVLAASETEASREDLDRVLRCRERGASLNRMMLAERELLRTEWRRLTESATLAQSLPREKMHGLHLNLQG